MRIDKKWWANAEIHLAVFAVVGVIAYFFIKRGGSPAKDAAGIGAAVSAVVPFL